MQLCYIESKSDDPMYNLALEQYVFDELPKDRQYFMLWQNNNAIIIGKNQNTVEEINREKVKKHDVKVVRRLSGGGAVYHDMKNLNFTFIADSGDMDELDMKVFVKPIIATLKECGINAQMTGRNDIVIDSKKFSGNSQYIKHGRVMHHGTIMFDSNLDFVQKVLSVSKDKIQSKGLKSVRSRMTNIKEHLTEDMSLEDFKDALKNNVFSGVDGVDIEEYHITDKDNEQINKIKEVRYATWEWNYGYSPKYSIIKEDRIKDCGKIELHLDIKDGRIQGLYAYGDYFGSGDISELENILKGRKLIEEDISDALQDVNISHYFNNMDKQAFFKLILS